MTNVVWVDVETTGLDPEEDFLLEVGITITSPGPVWAPIDSLSQVFPFNNTPGHDSVQVVQTMHETNGLWEECRKWMDLPFDSRGVEQQFMRFVEEHDALNSPMYGATAHFDRAWLRTNLPNFEIQFHYRNFDVSTLKAYAIAVRGDADWWMDREIHRALPDLQDSIANLVHFRNLFR